MSLPSMPYSDGRLKRASLTFGGVDYTPGAQAGQWEETENVSSREYPALVPRESREVIEQHTGETAIFVYDKIAKVVGTGFYYDGIRKGNVSPGPKQICVVGDYIIVYPDKLYYNMETDSITTYIEDPIPIPVAPGVDISGNRLTVPAESFVFEPTGIAGANLRGRGNIEVVNPTVLVYNGTWQEYVPTYFDQVRKRSQIQVDGQNRNVISVTSKSVRYWPGLSRTLVTLHYGTYTYKGGKEVPVEYGTVSGWAYAADTSPYTSDIPTEAVYTMKMTGSALTPTHVDKHYNEIEIGDIIRFDGTDSDHPTYEVVTRIERTLYTDHYFYTAIQTEKYEGTHLSYPSFIDIVSIYGLDDTKLLRISAGNAHVDCFLDSYDESEGKWVRFSKSIAALAGRGDITIQIVMEPTLEFICAHGNRLWGVAGNKIYASMWGDPKDFTTETATQADPWSTEIAEDGAWTGIISYSGALIAFKEHLMYRVVGTLPENYSTYTYHVEGVKRGCHKSMAIIGEVLYYLGPGGVYAYAGNVPQLISENFGTRVYSDGVGGTDGRRYYLSARHGGQWDLHVLDTEKGIWLREDDTQILDFAKTDRDVVGTTVVSANGDMYTTSSASFLLAVNGAAGEYVFTYDGDASCWMLNGEEADPEDYGITFVPPAREPGEEDPDPLPDPEPDEEDPEPDEEDPDPPPDPEPAPTDGDTITIRVSDPGFYALDAEGNTFHIGSGDEEVSWHAVTAKLFEDIQTEYTNMVLEHHSYSRLVIRIDLDAGSEFSVAISYDGGEFEPCYKQLASRAQTYNVPIVPRRCDNMRIRLEGHGFFRLRGIRREVHGGSVI